MQRIFAIFAALTILILAILWIMFPMLVLIRFSELLKAQRAIHHALLAANTGLDEIAKASQWMVDNWAERLNRVVK